LARKTWKMLCDVREASTLKECEVTDSNLKWKLKKKGNGKRVRKET